MYTKAELEAILGLMEFGWAQGGVRTEQFADVLRGLRLKIQAALADPAPKAEVKP